MIDLMIYVREKITVDKEAMPILHNEAIALELSPKPFWDADFYRHKIRQEEKKREESNL